MDPAFVSDGCTGFLNRWRGIDLTACCTAHDLAWFTYPGDWWQWLLSNLRLGACFASVGSGELSVPAMLAVSTIGALLYAFKPRRKKA